MTDAFTINRLATLFEHDRRRVARTLARVQPVAEKGRSRLYTVRQYLDAFMSGAEDDDGQPLDLTRERALLARAQRRLYDLQASEREAKADDLAWQDATIRAVALFVKLRLRPMSGWLFEALSRREVPMQPRAIAGQVAEWCLGIAAETEAALLEAAAEARTRNITITDGSQMLGLSNLPEESRA